MKCPVHNEEIRTEHAKEGVTGYCSLCGQHYRHCTSIKFMTMCDLSYGHTGPHMGWGEQWNDGDEGVGPSQ